jgi:hypothetical protein
MNFEDQKRKLAQFREKMAAAIAEIEDRLETMGRIAFMLEEHTHSLKAKGRTF